MLSAHEGYIYDSYREKLLSSALEKGELDSATSIIDDIVNDLEKCNIQTEEFVKVISYNVIGTMMQVAGKICFSSTRIVELLSAAEKAIEANNIRMLKTALADLAFYVCDNINVKGSASVVDAAAQYIINNHSNTSLSIPVIAKQFNIHPNYLSSIFKANTNSTIIEYVSQVRINASKKLLSETELSVKDISQKVGYNNPHTFTRIFKKFEGMTPTDYRKI